MLLTGQGHCPTLQSCACKKFQTADCHQHFWDICDNSCIPKRIDCKQLNICSELKLWNICLYWVSSLSKLFCRALAATSFYPCPLIPTPWTSRRCSFTSETCTQTWTEYTSYQACKGKSWWINERIPHHTCTICLFARTNCRPKRIWSSKCTKVHKRIYLCLVEKL